ncbi:MAG TPA: NYN domain-containing protein [Candidatus Paceibacterota bacterium]
MTKKEVVAIYIDGSNTYQRLKEMGVPEAPKRFNFSAFVQHLVGERMLVSKRYYIGIVKNFENSEKGDKMVKGQQKFLEGLRTEGFEVKSGRIMYDGGRIREKGVDVKLSVDLVIGAVDDLYDTAIVISSDTDLIPAIKYVRKAKGKAVEYIGFGANPSIGMIKECSAPRIFAKTDLMQFQTNAPQNK